MGSTEKDWISVWVAERIANGKLWRENWIGFVTSVPDGLVQQMLDRIEGEDIEKMRRGDPAALLALLADGDMVQRLFRRYRAARKEMLDAPNQKHELAYPVQRQIGAFLRSLPPDLTVSAVLQEVNSEIGVVEIDAVSDLFSNIGYPGYDLRGRLDPLQRERLRAYVKTAMEIAMAQDDFSGELKGRLASVLSMVGLPEDMPELDKLVRADLDRSRRGRAAWAAGDRTRRGNGGLTTNAGVYLKAMLGLDPGNADALLIAFLGEPEYVRDICEHLIREMALPKATTGHFQKTDYARIWSARELNGNLHNRDRRSSLAAALRARIDAVQVERTATSPAKQRPPYEYHLRQLAGALAAVDGHGSLEIVLDVLSLRNDFDNYTAVNTIETLLFNGVQVPAVRVIPPFEAVLDRIRKHGWQQQDSWLFARMLCLLPFLDPAEAGIDALRRLAIQTNFDRHWEFRDVVQALGYCRCQEGLEYLKEIGSDKDRLNHLGEAWLDAVAAFDTPQSRELLLRFIDRNAPGPAEGAFFDRDDHLASQIARIAGADPAIKDRLMQLSATDLPEKQRGLLAKIIGSFADFDAVLAGLNLIDDALSPSVPFEVREQLEGAFVERRPHGTTGNAFTLEPRNSNAIRAKLFEMASNDDRRRRSAIRLLAQIEEWRLRYGRPTGEPRHPAPESGLAWPLLP